MHDERRRGRTTATAAGLSAAALMILTAGCGSEESGAEDGPTPLPDETYRRVLAQGVEADAIYTIELPGFELAEQSAGVLGDSDYGASYVPVDPPYTTEVRLQVSSGTYDADRCASEPLQGPTGGSARPTESCEPDATGWYRTGGGWHEYVVLDTGHVMRISAPATAVDRDDLVAAALGARHQDGEAITPATPSSPITRGDLPTSGDGAPIAPYGSDKPGG